MPNLDTIISMDTLRSLYSPYEVQQLLAGAVRRRRKHLKLSRRVLAERSGVPAPTITRFERTGEISLRQFLRLWLCVDRLDALVELARDPKPVPRTIREVLEQ